MPIFGIKYDKFVTKSQAPTTPYGVPTFIVFQRQKQSPQKNPTHKNILNSLEKQ